VFQSNSGAPFLKGTKKAESQASKPQGLRETRNLMRKPSISDSRTIEHCRIGWQVTNLFRPPRAFLPTIPGTRRRRGESNRGKVHESNPQGNLYCPQLSRIFACWIKRSAGSDLETIAEMPAARASRSNAGSALFVNMTKGTRGINIFNARAASNPFMTGIERSKTINCGCSSCAVSTLQHHFPVADIKPLSLKQGAH
jgi:hypothetical protein